MTPLTAILALFITAPLFAVDLGRADGSFSDQGKVTPLRFAYAKIDDKYADLVSDLRGDKTRHRDLVILLTSGELPAEVLADDQAFFFFPRSPGAVTTIALRFSVSGRPILLHLNYGDNKPLDDSTFKPESLTIKDNIVEGSLQYEIDFGHHRLAVHSTFKAAIRQSAAPPPPPAVAAAPPQPVPQPAAPKAKQPSHLLPEGGGEPGKAWLAYDAALRKNDVVAIARSMTRAGAERMRNDQMFSVKQAFRPRAIEIVSGMVSGDAVTLEIRGSSMKTGSTARTRTATVTLLKENGAWRVESEEWR